MKKRTTPLILVGLIAAFLVACGGSSDPGPTPSPTSSPAASPSPTATPTPTPTPALPLNVGTPIPPVVGQVISAVTGRDPAPLLALVEYQQVGCTTAQGLGGPPKCRPGDPQGTVYRRFPSGVCEGEWAEDASPVISQIVTSVGDLYGAATLAKPQNDPEPYWPKGESVVMFRGGGNGGPGGYFILGGGRILRAHLLCDRGAGSEEATIKSLGATNYLIAPTTP
ncbi:MAG: hypothetical protein O2822_04310 [Chloroflexi bacterium]|nr:hypothetical protein [Chloroflexota bacterium]